ncbi:TIGR03118 family protein [Edaphobacter aggregans]|uniref:TIGR03118 family protein n=1 Tax=Edaphobacter aggregans TaxID=570835 RepID=UPI000553ABF9|nr:TIGR03118 family protein [Edaphobacter aggregans]
MKTFLRVTSGISLALSISAVAFGQHYTQVNLVSNTSGVAPVTDPTLINPWGLSRSSSSPWWISDNGTGLSTLFNGAGLKNSLVVTIPKADPNNKTFPAGTPTGTIFNSVPTDFILPGGFASSFLFATLDGAIVGWNAKVAIAPGAAAPSVNAVVAVKTTDGSSYTGLTSALVDGNRYLYAANFNNGRVDVYDGNFHPVTLNPNDQDQSNGNGNQNNNDNGDNNKAFTDRLLPRNYVPFNVQTIANNIVVTYVLHQQGQPRETDGPGLGYVDIFTAKGRLIQRLEHGDWLNAPWGVALAPQDFGAFSHDLLIGQFAGGGITQGSGTIAIYDLVTGQFKGLLQDANGNTIAINGLWDISPANNSAAGSYDPAGAPGSELYFTAGPNQGTGGLFGYLKPAATDLTEGNDQ